MSKKAKAFVDGKEIVGHHTKRVITDAEWAQFEAEAEAGYERVGDVVVPVGRPSLSPGQESRPLRVRVEPELDGQVRELARSEGKSISQLTRDALREYVAKRAA